MPRQMALLDPLRGSSARNPPPPERAEGDEEEEERWSTIPPELLGEVVRRLESSDGQWPLRKSLVSCACVCRRWRQVTTGVVGSPRDTGMITFAASLKQVDSTSFQILIYYVVFCRSDFFGLNFKIYDGQPPFDGAKASTNRASRRSASKQISPQVPTGNFEIGQVSYKFNLLKTRGPRRMLCTLQRTAENSRKVHQKIPRADASGSDAGSVVLKNKAPRWHEHLKCWCLNFHGRVTVASVKNFQLVASSNPNRAGDGTIDVNEPVLLQFGKVGDDMFTMDYREPLSAFQAFAICLTSFGTKFACE
ncbi:hypothetical protein B296_00002328 [Ensete ventricosum]|uniref:Tubby-like F-box protein n=1 Tax=Ensete ventricosum TaxID=4639 RepID=A0A427A670_ENSVE|nr:hypothetical protein B296_00002328 [Ensete ventricosum]